ncbi:hypothetical protein [Paenibacillus agilis]|uniref:Uncharacterized protein n=1 Tax=Paenibacillus agilis TaxID=3020863 RepID=A0A559J2K7_9BACL|nr:hypothetical protein [Paenibacillus agilis]TVX94066.1 hypothetical protein FPZ44_13975 [Paenibacillus agilis]
MKRIKLIVLALLLSLSVINVGVISADSSTPTHEVIKAEDIDNHSDVKQFITDQGAWNEIKSLQENNELQSSTNNLDRVYESDLLSHLSKERIDTIINTYDLNAPNVLPNNTIYIVEKSATSVSNVWYLNYSTNQSGFIVSVVNVGSDAIDSISGSLKKYNKSDLNWVSAGSTSFSRTQINTGTVSTWVQPITAVSDYFEYNITVKEDASVWNYNNTGQTNYQRYSFEVGNYNAIQALGGQRHHFVSQFALASNGYNSNTAPTIRMMTADHRLTPNWGSSHSAQNYRATESQLLKDKQYRPLLQMEVDAFKLLPDPEGKFPRLSDKYMDALVVALDRYERLFGLI